MLAVVLPFLVSANTLGVVLMLAFLASSVIFMIPAMATRGGTQLAWFSVGSLLLLIELAIFVTLVVLTSQGKIFQ
ncbi:MAG TPA: hypothetical protein VFY90_02950 [Tepidiformaceae bacterium]|nr:hypothetical protein [Tepidiformaceae bacterium]